MSPKQRPWTSHLDGVHDADGYGAWLSELAQLVSRPKLLLGHSFGSVIVAAAIAQDALHEGAVLVNPILASPLTGPRQFATAVVRAYYTLARVLPDGLGRRLLASRLIAGIGGTLMTSTTDHRQRKWIRDEHFRQAASFFSRDSVLESFIASTTTTVADYAEHLTGPTLVIGADRDPLSPAPTLRYEDIRLADGSFHLFPDRGHLLPYEETNALAHLIIDWDRALLTPGAGTALRRSAVCRW